MRELKLGTVYRHFKGNLYYVHNVAIHSETKEKYVIYQGLYGNYEMYIRPYDIFMEKADRSRVDNVTHQNFRFETITKLSEVNKDLNIYIPYRKVYMDVEYLMHLIKEGTISLDGLELWTRDGEVIDIDLSEEEIKEKY